MSPSREEPVAVVGLYQQAIDTLQRLIGEAAAGGDREPTAMNLASVDGEGRVSSRIVLLKGAGTDGLRFFSNYHSAKAIQLAAHPQAALSFHWKPLGEQVQARFEGRVEKLPVADSDAYFATRPRLSQIGAWASLQSQPLPDRATFDARVEHYEAAFKDIEVARPPHWGGYRLVPDLIEFWYGARYRLHERVRYRLLDGAWSSELLYP
jgi:pyridoxamine 5'-phosphate oxidase